MGAYTLPKVVTPGFSDSKRKPTGPIAVDRENQFGRHLVRAFCMDQRNPHDIVNARPLTLNGNHATYVGGAWLFDGTSHYLEGHNDDLDTGPFTVVCRQRLDNAADNYYIPISVGDASNQNGFRLQRSAFFGGWEFRIVSGGTNDTLVGADATIGVFETLIGTFDGSTMRFYIDGVLQDTGSVSAPDYSGGNVNLRVGAWINGGSEWDGAIDYIQYFNFGFEQSHIDEFLRAPYQAFKPMAPDVAFSVSGDANIVIDVPSGSISITGQAPTATVSDNGEIAVPVASLAISGALPTVALSDNHIRAPPAGSIALTGLAPTIVALSRNNELSSTAEGTGTGNPCSLTSASFTPPDNSLLVVFVSGVNGVGGADIRSGMTLSGGGLTWTKRLSGGGATTAGYTSMAEVWTAPVATGASMSLTWAHDTGNFGNDKASFIWNVFSFTGYNTASPIGGSITKALSDGADSMTLSATPDASSIVVGGRYFSSNGANSNATPGSGFTEAYDQNSITAGYGNLQTMHRGSSTSTTVDWTDTDDGNQTSWGNQGLALEIKAASDAVSVQPDSGTLVTEPHAPAIEIGINGALASLQISGKQPTIQIDAPTALSPEAGVLTLTRPKPTILIRWLRNPDAGALTITGQAPSIALSDHESGAPDAGALSISGLAPTVSLTANHEPAPGTGSLTLAGLAPDTGGTNITTPGAASSTITGQAPTISVSSNNTAQPDAGSLAITGLAPTFSMTGLHIVQPGTGTLVLTGKAPFQAGAGNPRKRRKKERIEDIRRASQEALKRRQRKKALEEKRRKILATKADNSNVDTILRKVYKVDAELERLHEEMLANQLRLKKRRKRDKIAALLLLN